MEYRTENGLVVHDGVLDPRELGRDGYSRLGPTDLTYELACYWRRFNTHNRKPKPKRQPVYARDMQNGNWMVNGHAIVFDTEGVLLDGWNRIAARVKAGPKCGPVPVEVVFGLPRKAQDTMDTGASRTMADVLTLDGETHTPTLGSALSYLILWDRGFRVFSGNTSPSFLERKAYLEDHPEVRRSTAEASRIAAKVRTITPSVLAVSYALCCRVDSTEATWFFQRIADGANVPLGHPVLALRDAAQRDKNSRKHVSFTTHLSQVIRAWNHMRAGNSIMFLKTPEGKPVPDPK